MAAIASVSIDLSKLDKSLLKVKGTSKYLNVDILIRDEVNQYNQNVAVYHTQSKEERESKTDKKYVGNGKAVWSKGEIVTVAYNAPKKLEEVSEDLDF
jgi:uncharacterized protein YacL (UPF0231 family)